ncbi:hypothetical protein HPB50_012648 [Hyalomma asiaticum]|uniref:Uncharacterized protein n=1 Tax=Hyalomma asiaticum TaxID=266040 RepID=A0ACB7SXM7_HYAAI|nr:hypothetical protein HPB50_012648 [Hyalomma asiaticum]
MSKRISGESGCRQAVAPSGGSSYPCTRARGAQGAPADPPVDKAVYECEVCSRAFGTQRGLSLHQTKARHKRPTATKVHAAKADLRKVHDATGDESKAPRRGHQGEGEGATVDGSEGVEIVGVERALNEVTGTPSGSEGVTESEPRRGRQLSETTCETSGIELSAKVPEKEQNKGRRKANSEHTAPEVLDAAVAHTPTGHTMRASVCVDRRATPGPPDPIVMPSAVVCEPSGGHNDGAFWRGTGARPKDGRTIPPGQVASAIGPRRLTPRSCANSLAPTTVGPMTAESEPDPHVAMGTIPEVTHTPRSHALGATDVRDELAPPDPPVPAVRTAVVVRGPADGKSQGSIWRSTGARLRGRRILPSDLLSDSSDSEEDPAFCRDCVRVLLRRIYANGVPYGLGHNCRAHLSDVQTTSRPDGDLASSLGSGGILASRIILALALLRSRRPWTGTFSSGLTPVGMAATRSACADLALERLVTTVSHPEAWENASGGKDCRSTSQSITAQFQGAYAGEERRTPQQHLAALNQTQFGPASQRRGP